MYKITYIRNTIAGYTDWTTVSRATREEAVRSLGFMKRDKTIVQAILKSPRGDTIENFIR